MAKSHPEQRKMATSDQNAKHVIIGYDGQLTTNYNNSKYKLLGCCNCNNKSL